MISQSRNCPPSSWLLLCAAWLFVSPGLARAQSLGITVARLAGPPPPQAHWEGESGLVLQDATFGYRCEPLGEHDMACAREDRLVVYNPQAEALDLVAALYGYGPPERQCPRPGGGSQPQEIAVEGQASTPLASAATATQAEAERLLTVAYYAMHGNSEKGLKGRHGLRFMLPPATTVTLVLRAPLDCFGQGGPPDLWFDWNASRHPLLHGVFDRGYVRMSDTAHTGNLLAFRGYPAVRIQVIRPAQSHLVTHDVPWVYRGEAYFYSDKATTRVRAVPGHPELEQETVAVAYQEVAMAWASGRSQIRQWPASGVYLENDRTIPLRNGGPTLAAGYGYGPLGNAPRLRLGYELAHFAPSLLSSWAVDSDLRGRTVASLTLGLGSVPWWGVPLPMLLGAARTNEETWARFPSLHVGLGLPVQVRPDFRPGLRLRAGADVKAVGLVVDWDWYPEFAGHPAGWQTTGWLQVGL